MTTSSLAARRKYFEKSSLTFASATAWVWRALFVEPRLRLFLGDDGEDFNRCFPNVIEHPDVSHPQRVLWLCQPAQPLDTTLAQLSGFVPKVILDGILNPPPEMTPERPETLCSRAAKSDARMGILSA